MKRPTFGENDLPWTVRQFQSPSSFSALPVPRFPSKTQCDYIQDLKRTLVESSGIQPGIYSSLDSSLFDGVDAVYAGLKSKLLEELTGVDVLDLCIRLYKRHEELLGLILKSQHNLAALRKFGDSRGSPMEIQILWESLSPYTESIRWLIEIAVKHCDSPGKNAKESRLDLLIELARSIVEWDMIWEIISHKVIPHEVIVDNDFFAKAQPTPKADKAWQAYRRALMPGMAESERDQFELFQSPRNEMSLEDIMDRTGLKELDEPLMQERGYNMNDLVKFFLGLTDSFGEREYFRSPRQSNVVSFLSGKWKLDPQRLERLFLDYGLSGQTLVDVDSSKMLPVENARRDSRLLRRPVVLVERRGIKYCLYGVETQSLGFKMVLARIMSGRIDFIKENPGGTLKKAIGTLQEKSGLPFEHDIANRCTELGFYSRHRKETIWGRRLPPGKGFGPVDVFVVDRKARRFVLVEAKDVLDEGPVPKEMKYERQEFIEYLEKLRLQTSWFEDHSADLKSEYGITPEEDYSVEGVIVVNNPRPWMFTCDEPLPIVDDREFFNLLKGGKKLSIAPIVA